MSDGILYLTSAIGIAVGRTEGIIVGSEISDIGESDGIDPVFGIKSGTNTDGLALLKSVGSRASSLGDIDEGNADGDILLVETDVGAILGISIGLEKSDPDDTIFVGKSEGTFDTKVGLTIEDSGTIVGCINEGDNDSSIVGIIDEGN